MITLITGMQASGKTTKAREITKGKNSVWLYEDLLKSPFCFNRVDSKTEYIVIDEVKNREAVGILLVSEKLQIERQCKKAEIIDMPNIILISQNLNREDFPNPNIKVIECTGVACS